MKFYVLLIFVSVNFASRIEDVVLFDSSKEAKKYFKKNYEGPEYSYEMFERKIIK